MMLRRLLFLVALPLLCSPSIAQDKVAAASAGTAAGNWRLVGPKEPMQEAEGGDVGRISSVVFHPSQPHTIYAATPVGGLWRTQDDGANWMLLSNLPKLGITEIAVNPLAPDTMYMLTGDGDGRLMHGPPSVGVLKSVNGGQDWAQTGLSFDAGQPGQMVWGHRLVIHPTTPTILMAATTAGLFRTTDGGQTWALVITGIIPLDRKSEFWDIRFHPTDPSVVYAASTTQVYRSTDSGGTWTALRGGLPTYSDLCSYSNCNFYPNFSNRIRLAVTPASPDTLYVLYGSPRGFTIGLYRSDDRGNTFGKRSSTTPVSKDPNAPVPLDLAQPNIFGYNNNDFASQSNYTIGLAISPTNADLVHVGAVDTWESDDGGRTWKRTSRWSDDPDNRQYVHADVHELTDRGGTLYAATDGGIYRSGDGGNTWESITKMTTGITIAQIYHVCGGQREPDVLYYGAQDNGSYRLNTNGAISKIAGGDGFVCQVDPRYPNTVYVGLPYGDIYRTDDVAHADVRMGGYAHVTPTAGGASISGSWLTPFILSPADPNSIYACYADLWYSSDRGLSWVNLTNGALGESQECRQVAVSPSDPKTIYVAKEASWDQAHTLGDGDARTPLLGGGGVFRSTDSGATWQWVTGTLPLADAAVTDLAVSPTDSRRVWVTFGGYRAGTKVFGTTDGGVTWTNLSSGLPGDYPANALAVENGNTNGVYVGTDDGVYYRDDRLEKWLPFREGLPNTIVTSLLIDQSRHRLFAATFGRGVWMSDLYAP
jgi:photosystem II stability/assembly factor-like uncharacterized protein